MEIQEINKRVKEQEDNYNEIRQLLSNMKKDSVSRQTLQYLEDRKNRLNNILRKSEIIHKELEVQEVLSMHKYITLNYFDNNIKNTYIETIEHMDNIERRLQAARQLYEPNNDDDNDKKNETAEKNVEQSPKLRIQNFRMSIHQKVISSKDSNNRK